MSNIIRRQVILVQQERKKRKGDTFLVFRLELNLKIHKDKRIGSSTSLFFFVVFRFLISFLRRVSNGMDTRKEKQEEKKEAASHEIRERDVMIELRKGQQYHHITNDAMVSRMLTNNKTKVCGWLMI